MIDYEIQRLDENNRHLLENFSCIESDESLEVYDSKRRRRIKKHSKEMDDFLQEEAWMDQEKGLSTTYLFVYNDELYELGGRIRV